MTNPLNLSPEDRRQFEDDARADMLADIARDEDMDHARASVLDGEA